MHPCLSFFVYLNIQNLWYQINEYLETREHGLQLHSSQYIFILGITSCNLPFETAFWICLKIQAVRFTFFGYYKTFPWCTRYHYLQLLYIFWIYKKWLSRHNQWTEDTTVQSIRKIDWWIQIIITRVPLVQWLHKIYGWKEY
jgi:hypothetical protein